jgi:hypothetical protein
MRVFILGACLLLAGCSNSPGRGELFMSADEVSAKDDAVCRSYGVTPGSDAYVNCRMQNAQLRDHAAERRSRAVGQALHDFNETQRQQMQAYQRPVFTQPVTCTSRPTGFGTTTTQCQ